MGSKDKTQELILSSKTQDDVFSLGVETCVHLLKREGKHCVGTLLSTLFVLLPVSRVLADLFRDLLELVFSPIG